MAPEYASEGIVSTNCDAYSFGIMLLEMYTRRRPTDELFSNEISLKSWVNLSLTQDTILDVVDTNSFGTEDDDNVLKWSGISVELGLLVLQSYLTDIWKISFTHAAAILNIWGGISLILQVFLLFLVDAYLGHFKILVLTSIAYTLGIGFISMSVPPIFASFYTGACKEYDASCIGNTHKCFFYIGMVLVAIGISGHQVSLDPFLEEQNPPVEEQNPTCTSRWILPIIKQIVIGVLIPVVGTLLLPLSKLWWICFVIPAICIAIATVLFSGSWYVFNRNNIPQGSPLTNVCRVFVASSLKLSQPLPLVRSSSGSRYPRFLEKATIVTSNENPQTVSRWKHCSVAEVEEAKTMVRMLPIWMISIMCGVVSSMGKTYFFEQGSHLNRRVGKINIPLPVMLLLLTWVKNIFNKADDHHIRAQCFTGSAKQVFEAIACSGGCCLLAMILESGRLYAVMKHNLLDRPDDDIPLSMFWLLPQFIILGVTEGLYEKGMSEFYESETPQSMKNYLNSFRKGVNGLGYMFSIFLVYIVGQISERGGKHNWFQFTLNRSRLDKYYFILAALCFLNYILFMLVCILYKRTGISFSVGGVHGEAVRINS